MLFLNLSNGDVCSFYIEKLSFSVILFFFLGEIFFLEEGEVLFLKLSYGAIVPFQ